MKMNSLYILFIVLSFFFNIGCDSENEDSTPTPPQADTRARNCITDIQDWYSHSDEILRKRFDVFKENGVEVLRVEVDWAMLETSENQWNDNHAIFNYLKIAKEYDFRIKLILGVMMAPPAWYLDAHPEARLIDQNGGTTGNTMSYWYPDLKNVITEKSNKIVKMLKDKGLWDQIDYIIPTLGSAGEPIYPPLWTLPSSFTEHTFWGYSASAKSSFKDYIKNKYSSIDQANSAWGTFFNSWDEVTVFQPKTLTGQYWDDMLTWYRDAKREYILWQCQQVKGYTMGTEKKVLVYVPGVGYSEDDWANAVQSGDGNDNIKIMADTDFIIDMAAENSYMLQTTGSENETEMRRIRRYIDSKGYDNLEVWCENAGDKSIASGPEYLAKIVVENNFFGLDYTHAIYAFKDNSYYEPSEIMSRLKRAYQMIDNLYLK